MAPTPSCRVSLPVKRSADAVMGGYAVFLAPITGTLVWDFFFVHQRKLKLTALVNFVTVFVG